jgi:hypothetical protein
MGVEVDGIERTNVYYDGILLERARNWARRPFCMLPCGVQFFVRERMSLQYLANKLFRWSLINVLFLGFEFFVGLYTAVSFI